MNLFTRNWQMKLMALLLSMLLWLVLHYSSKPVPVRAPGRPRAAASGPVLP